MPQPKNEELQFERIVFFSDAVFAIAITLLIIEIKIPHIEHNVTEREFWLALFHLGPKFIGFFFSFLVIGAYWTGHHRLYGHIVRWNYGLIWRNILFLMAIAFMPFSTAFLSEYIFRFAPLAVYAATFSAAGLLQLAQWRYALKQGFVDDSEDPLLGEHITQRLLLLPAVGIVAIIIGLINPMFAGLAFIMIPIMMQVFKKRYARRAKEIEGGEEAPEPAEIEGEG
jgi:uncharacterized membrane protein